MKGRIERTHPLGRPGDDLLSRALRRSTIGPGGLNDRVRNGIGWGPSGNSHQVNEEDVRRHHRLAQLQTAALHEF